MTKTRYERLIAKIFKGIDNYQRFLFQQHETFLPNGDRAGFLIGDGAGVGKGRTIAGIIYENYLLSRKRALW